MSRPRLPAAFGVILLFVGAMTAAAAPLDLSTWVSYDQPYIGSSTFGVPGQWVVGATGDSVEQVRNGVPTFFVSPDGADGNRTTATFVAPDIDDDFFGIALGFDTSPSDPSTDYLLIDWKRADQTVNWELGVGPADAQAGLAVSRVTGVAMLDELWGHLDSEQNPNGGVIELARGTLAGSTGWVPGVSYEFRVEYTTDRLDVWVNDVHEISITGDFPAGPLALYNFSQPGVQMSGLTSEPLNEAPNILDGGAPDVAVGEGEVGMTSGAFLDPDGDALTLSCTGNCDGFVPAADASWTWSQLLPEGPEAFTVAVTATDGELSTTDEFSVVVANLAPVITSAAGPGASHDLSEPATLNAAFTDPGVLDTHTASISWGDGTITPGVVDQGAGSGSLTGSHHYVEPGFYSISITVTDDDGASDSVDLGEVFVFDPDTFVTGGGWIISPEGAWTDMPTHTGKLTFGFVVRYDRTGSVRGNLQVQLHKGINLHAKAFDYLLINDGIAVFEGSGSVNGVDGFDFHVVAADERHAAGAEDRFWIRISRNGSIVYNDGSYPTGLAVRGKGIQIHTK